MGVSYFIFAVKVKEFIDSDHRLTKEAEESAKIHQYPKRDNGSGRKQPKMTYDSRLYNKVKFPEVPKKDPEQQQAEQSGMSGEVTQRNKSDQSTAAKSSLEPSRVSVKEVNETVKVENDKEIEAAGETIKQNDKESEISDPKSVQKTTISSLVNTRHVQNNSKVTETATKELGENNDSNMAETATKDIDESNGNAMETAINELEGNKSKTTEIADNKQDENQSSAMETTVQDENLSNTKETTIKQNENSEEEKPVK